MRQIGDGLPTAASHWQMLLAISRPAIEALSCKISAFPHYLANSVWAHGSAFESPALVDSKSIRNRMDHPGCRKAIEESDGYLPTKIVCLSCPHGCSFPLYTNPIPSSYLPESLETSALTSYPGSGIVGLL